MRSILLTALLVPAAGLIGQNGEFHFVHGLPGVPAPVDVAVNGSVLFSGVTFGELESAPLAPGSYTVDVIGSGGSVLLSNTATVAADESVSVAAHLVTGGAPTLSTFENDLSAVGLVGNGRITVRHLADASILLASLTSQTSIDIGFLANGVSWPSEVVVDTFRLDGVELTGTSGQISFPLPPSALLADNLTVAADTGLEVYIVGSAGNFTVIRQDLDLEAAVPPNPGACDLTLSGSFVGGSLSAGGDVTYDLTSAAANSLVALFLGTDNTPTTIFNIPLGIGGGVGILGFGMSDANGDFSQTVVYPGLSIGLPPGSIDFLIQAASATAFAGGFSPTCISDIETLQINLP